MKQVTRADFESEIIGSKGPVPLGFYTGRCQPCNMKWFKDSISAAS